MSVFAGSVQSGSYHEKKRSKFLDLPRNLLRFSLHANFCGNPQGAACSAALYKLIDLFITDDGAQRNVSHLRDLLLGVARGKSCGSHFLCKLHRVTFNKYTTDLILPIDICGLREYNTNVRLSCMSLYIKICALSIGDKALFGKNLP